MKTTALDLIGVACIAVASWFVWHPAPLVVVGAACLLVSWAASRGDQ